MNTKKKESEIEVRQKLLTKYDYVLPLLAELNVKLKFIHGRRNKEDNDKLANIEEIAEMFISYKTPAFQSYTQDIRSSDDVRAMTDTQYRVYFEMLFASWNNKCFLPTNFRYLSKVATKTIGTFTKAWEATVSEKFSITSDKKFIYNDRLLTELIKQIKNSIEGRKAVEKRHGIVPAGHKFSESPYYEIKKFLAALKKPEYKKYAEFDHEYYYDAVKNWSARQSTRCEDWIGMAVSFMQRNDAEGKAVMKGQKGKPKVVSGTNGHGGHPKASVVEKARTASDNITKNIKNKLNISLKENVRQ